jgi:quercetin dioxygenase-like cupin family protein
MHTRLQLGSAILLGLVGQLTLTAALASGAGPGAGVQRRPAQMGPLSVLHAGGMRDRGPCTADPAKKNADVLFKVPAGAVIPRHWHTSAERMVLLSGELQVIYDGQPTATLTPGMYGYGPAKLPHKATCNKGASCVLFIAFESPVDATPESDIAK